MIIKVYASDGKEFKGEDYKALEKEVNAYESELKQKELERQERLRKLEEERKAKQDAKEKSMKWITDCVDLVNQAIEKYKDSTGEKPDIEFVNENGKLVVKKPIYYSSLLNLYPKWWDSLFS